MKRTNLITLTLSVIASMAIVACGGSGAAGDPGDSGDPGDTGTTGVNFLYSPSGTEATLDGLAADSLTATIIEIPETIEGYTVTKIGAHAFSNKTGITSVSLPSSVKEIGPYAFSGCSSLATVSLPEGLTVISDFAFSNCVNLTAVNIPATVTTIAFDSYDYCPFLGCTSLSNLTVTSGSSKFASVDGMILSADGINVIYAAPGMTGQVSIPDSVQYIYPRAFEDRTKITGLLFGSNPKLKNVGQAAFESSGLTAVDLPDTVTSVYPYAFRSCTSLVTFKTGNGLTQIGSQALYGCTALQTVEFGTAMAYFDTNAFDRSAAIENFFVAAGNATYISDGGVLYNAAKTTLMRYPAAKYYTLHAFPATLTTLANKAFADYYGIKLEIPASVVTIGEYCFTYTNLTNWTWHATSSSASLGNYAFSGNTGLTSCTFKMTTPPTAGGSSIFYGYRADFCVKVPAASVSAYKAATSWSTFASIIVAL